MDIRSKKHVVYYLLLRSILMETFFLSIGQVASLLGVCTKTLRRWDSANTFNADFRTPGNHRRYKKARILGILRKRKRVPKRTRSALYGKVSSSRQKKSGDLKRQLSKLSQFAVKKGYSLYKSYSDVGSGLNDKRRDLLQLLKDAALRKFEVVIVNYNDRLERFGLQIVKEYLKSWNVQLEVIHLNIVDNSPHAELNTDLIAILYSFMDRLCPLFSANGAA
ncbi:MAG: IS607 family transposase [Promethearchaeota archaeon]